MSLLDEEREFLHSEGTAATTDGAIVRVALKIWLLNHGFHLADLPVATEDLVELVRDTNAGAYGRRFHPDRHCAFVGGVCGYCGSRQCLAPSHPATARCPWDACQACQTNHRSPQAEAAR